MAEDGDRDLGRLLGAIVAIVAAVAKCSAVALALVGPWAMRVLFGSTSAGSRAGLAAIGLGVGFHLVSGALNQALLARGQARVAAASWIMPATAFLMWLCLRPSADPVVAVEFGYAATTAAIAASLAVVVLRSRT